ncbi:hypothetical protein [Mycobacterium phage WXIN]|nr:hypothetical protein [Mycobacterium phage WXIN]
MPKLTPERLRDAAEVVASYVLATDPIEHKNTHRVSVSANMLLEHAERLEREQAAEVKRDKRAKELAMELAAVFNATTGGSESWWPQTAHILLDRYPALLEAGEFG